MNTNIIYFYLEVYVIRKIMSLLIQFYQMLKYLWILIYYWIKYRLYIDYDTDRLYYRL